MLYIFEESFYASVCSLTIWVGHLPPRTTPEQLKEAFGEFGEVESIDVSS